MHPRLLDHENVYNRDVFLAVLDRLDVHFQAKVQFACFCVLDRRGIKDSFHPVLFAVREVVGSHPPDS